MRQCFQTNRFLFEEYDKCFDKLKEFKNDKNKTIVIVSHSLDSVKMLCNRAIWIYDGKVRMDGKPEEVIKNYLEILLVLVRWMKK